MKHRTAHLHIVKDGPGDWGVYVVVDDGRWKITTKCTAEEAQTVALQKIAARQPREMEVTA